MTDQNQRLIRILQATPQQQSEIDRILEGLALPEPEPVRGPLLLTATQAAKLSGLSRSTLWRLEKRRLLSRVEVLPGTFRFRRADIEALARGTAGREVA